MLTEVRIALPRYTFHRNPFIVSNYALWTSFMEICLFHFTISIPPHLSLIGRHKLNSSISFRILHLVFDQRTSQSVDDSLEIFRDTRSERSDAFIAFRFIDSMHRECTSRDLRSNVLHNVTSSSDDNVLQRFVNARACAHFGYAFSATRLTVG